MLHPHLGGQEDFLPGNTGFPDGAAHLLLVEIALGGIQRAVAHLQGIQHAALTFLRGHLIDTVAHHGHPHTVVQGYIFHCRILHSVCPADRLQDAVVCGILSVASGSNYRSRAAL